MATKQGFYSKVHLYDDLTISVFHFHFPFLVSISTVFNCPAQNVQLFVVFSVYSTEIIKTVKTDSPDLNKLLES